MRVPSLLVVAVVAALLAVPVTGLYVDAASVGDAPSADASSNGVTGPLLDEETANETVSCPIRAGTGVAAGTDREPPDEPALVEAYPNPTIENNVGEYVVLETPAKTNVANWTLTDGHRTARLPNETVDGRVALTTNPNATESLTDAEPLELDGALRFAADGDTLELRDEGEVIDVASYDRAPLAEVWYRDASALDQPDRGTWWPHEATCVPPTRTESTDARVFVLPDAPEVAIETIEAADDRLLLAGYTLTSESIATELLEAADRGVDVRVLVESGPVGGTPADAEPVLADLEAGGVDVRATGGDGARYDFHHPKYAVADDTVLVTTENWKASGIDGEGSRGWGVAIEDRDLAAALTDVFRADFEGRDTVSGDRFRERATFVEEDGRSKREYPTEHEPETVGVESAELLVAPDNAEERLVELIAGADEELLIEQASLGGTDVSLVEEALEAARRGVEVRILLDSTWYVEDENRAIAAELERTASEEDLSLEVELVEPGDRFEKIHAKGVVIDGETAVIGSANWNQNALENNREVLLVLHGEEAGAYYAAVFEDDWEGDSWPFPVEFGLAVVIALLTAAHVGRRHIEFGDERPPPTADWDGSHTEPETGPAGSEITSSAPWTATTDPTPVQGSIGEAPITIVPRDDVEPTDPTPKRKSGQSGGPPREETESRNKGRESDLPE